MAGEQQQYGEGEDPTLVHRDVAVLFKRMAVLESMLLDLNVGGVKITGKLEIGEGGCVLTGK